MAYVASAAAFLYATMGTSQAMRTSFFEDVVSVVPSLAFLVGTAVAGGIVVLAAVMFALCGWLLLTEKAVAGGRMTAEQVADLTFAAVGEGRAHAVAMASVASILALSIARLGLRMEAIGPLLNLGIQLVVLGEQALDGLEHGGLLICLRG